MTRAAFLFSFTPDIIDQARDLGINTLFVSHRLLTSETLAYAQSRHLKVNAEFGVFQGKDLWDTHPECRPCWKGGEPISPIDWYYGVSPAAESVRHEKWEELSTLLKEFNVDGVWLDFIRFPTHWEVPEPELLDTDYRAETVARFRRETGETTPEGAAWNRWKCNLITSFVARCREIVDKEASTIPLGIFTVPWQEDEFGEAMHSIICQDLPSIAPFVDVLSPMTYHGMCGRPVEWIKETMTYVKSVTGKPILPLVQTENKQKELSPESFARALEYASQQPLAEGAIIFFLDDLLKQDEKKAILKDHWGVPPIERE